MASSLLRSSACMWVRRLVSYNGEEIWQFPADDMIILRSSCSRLKNGYNSQAEPMLDTASGEMMSTVWLLHWRFTSRCKVWHNTIVGSTRLVVDEPALLLWIWMTSTRWCSLDGWYGWLLSLNGWPSCWLWWMCRSNYVNARCCLRKWDPSEIGRVIAYVCISSLEFHIDDGCSIRFLIRWLWRMHWRTLWTSRWCWDCGSGYVEYCMYLSDHAMISSISFLSWWLDDVMAIFGQAESFEMSSIELSLL